MSAREAAARALLALELERSTLATELDRARRHVADDRDRALLVEITTGVLRWRAELDALLAPCLARPIAQADPAIRAILRSAAYQLEHLDRVPAHAIVNDAVALTRPLGQPRASGFVNAALRTWLRTRPQIQLPAKPTSINDRDGWIAYLSTTLSHPAWLVSRWFDRHGADATEIWCRFNNRVPAVSMRAYSPKDRDEIAAAAQVGSAGLAPLAFVDDGWRFTRGADDASAGDVRSKLVAQDEASQLVAHLVGAQPGDRVLDLCAAPGGKSLVLAADMDAADPTGLLVACDTRPRRLRILAATLKRGDVPRRLVQLDATQPLPFAPIFDRVFVDAPCSGLGVLGRDPDIKWSRELEDLPALAAKEAAILRSAAAVVRRGGRLIYATCSSEPDENEAVVDAFLDERPDYARVQPSAGPHVRQLDALLTPRGDLQTWPFKHDLDAFFAAFLVRREAP